MITRYFSQIRADVEKFNHITSFSSFKEKSYSERKGFISGDIVFIDESSLEFAEVKEIGRASTIKYRYHYMNSAKELIFRYDNAKHYPNLPTFPHHKHLPNSVVESEAPNIESVLMEIESIVVNSE